MSDFGFGFDVGGKKASGGGSHAAVHKGLASHSRSHGHSKKKHHHHRHQEQDQGGGSGGGSGDSGGGGGAPQEAPEMPEGDEDTGEGTDEMGWERTVGDWDLGPSGHRNPMSFEGDAPGCGPSCQCDDCGRNYGGGGDPLVGGYSRSPLGAETGYEACDPRGRNYGGGGDPLVGGYSRYPLGAEHGCDPHTKFGVDDMGWEFDGPGYFGNDGKVSGELSSHPKSFGGDLTMPILSNWGRYPKRSPLVGVFAGDITPPILSNWGRYPKGSPYKGVFAGDTTPPILSNWGRYPSRSPYAGVFAADPSQGIHPMAKRPIKAPSSSNAMRFAMRKSRSPFTGHFTGDGSHDIGNEFSAGIGVWRRAHQQTCDVMGWETDGMSGFGLDDDAWASLASAGISAAAGITTAAIASSNRQPVYVAPPAPIGPPAAVTQTLPPSHPVHHRRHRKPLPYFNPPPPPLPDYYPPPYTYFQPPAYSYTPPPVHTGMPLGYPAETPVNYPPPPKFPPPPGVTNQGGTMVFAPDTITAPRPGGYNAPPGSIGYTGSGSWDPGY